MAYLSMPNPGLYTQAIRSGAAVTYTVDASYFGSPVDGATDLRPTGGSIADTTKAGVRRILSLELAPEPGLYDLLSPIGTTLTVTAHVRLTDRSTVDVPMGVFDIDEQTLTEGGGNLTATAPDKWVRLQRRKFAGPQQSNSAGGITVVQQIITLIRNALGPTEPVNVTATSTALVGALTWQSDRAQAIIDLATSIGAWVYADRTGVFTIADIPTIGMSADWLIDSSASGVLTSLSRSRSRTSTANVVCVESTAASGAAFPMQIVWDSDPTSPTFAGPNDGTTSPITHPELAGPFGVVVYNYDSSQPLSVSQARSTALAILAQVVGLASQATLGSVPNPAIDAFDVIDVMPPGPVTASVTGGGAAVFPGASIFPGASVFPADGRPRRVQWFASGRTVERHAVDTVTHPLVVGGSNAQQIQGRSTRTDPFA